MRIAGSLLPLLPSLTLASLPRALLESFGFYFNSFAGGGPFLLLGQLRDRWRAPLEILTQVLEIYLAFLEVTHYYQQSVQIALVSRHV